MSALPQGWQLLRLGEVVARTSNVDPSKSPAEEFELYSVPSFSDNRPEFSFGSEIKSAKQAVQSNDVLLCKIVPHINRVWVVGAKSDKRQIASGEWIVYRDHGCDPSYLRYCLTEQSFRDRFMQTVAGVGGSLMRARPSEVAEIEVPLAPLPEQRRIVSKIDSLTGKSRRARDHLDHIPRLVEKYKQAVLAAAFRGNLTREWRAKYRDVPDVEPRPSIRKKYAETADFVAPYDLPTAWRWLRLPELGELDRGKSRHRPRNDKRLFGGPYPFIQTGEVRQADRFLRNHSETYSAFGLAQSRLWPIGTVCITIAANIAETAILAIDACFPDSVVGFLPDTDRIDASYVEFFLRTAREELEAFAPATAQKNINLDVLATIRVPVAPVQEQLEIIRRIETAISWIDHLATEATSARKLIGRLDQTVLAKAFRGELVPQDPTDEPASVLLERIKTDRAAASSSAPRRGRRSKPAEAGA
jgi:type I restriction enzyme S subunit